jgi:hypothetical protein
MKAVRQTTKLYEMRFHQTRLFNSIYDNAKLPTTDDLSLVISQVKKMCLNFDISVTSSKLFGSV